MKKTIFALTLMLISFCGFDQVTYSKDYYENTVAKDQYGNTQ